MRLLEYARTVTRDIATQPLRCGLTVAAITLSSALLVTLVSIGTSTRDALVGHFSGGDALSTVLVSANSSVSSGFFSTSVQQTQANSEKLTDDTVARLSEIPHVTSATPQVAVWELKSFQLADSPSYVATAVATTGSSLERTPLAAGEWFANDDTKPRVVLGNSYLRALGIDDPQSVVGQTLSFTTVSGYRGVGADLPAWNADAEARRAFDQSTTKLTATVVGVTEKSASDNRIYLPLTWGRQVQSPRTATPTGETSVDNLERTGYTNILLTTDSQDAVASVETSVNELGFGAITYQRQIEQINQLSLIMLLILGAVALISLISASLGIVNTLLMSISEQKRTIQIWRAAGASQGLISRLYVLQAIVLSSIGALLGACIGYVACRYLNTKLEAVLSAQGMATLQLPDTPIWILIGSVVISVTLALLAALYPAYIASRKLVD